jgi:hypothetical protein
MRYCITYLILHVLAPYFLLADHGKKEKQEDSTHILVTRLNINSPRSDFGPVVIGNKLYFSSAREHRMGARIVNLGKGDVVDIFVCDLRDSIHAGKVRAAAGPINSQMNDSPGSFNKNADKIFLSRNAQTGTGLKPLKIYSSSRHGSKWSKPEALSFCCGNYNFCHPSLMNDQKTIVFASDIPGGFGGMDIYYSKFENGEWAQPKNFGAKINSKFNDIFPFVSDNNTLFFASDRPGGFGGLDIYKLDLNDQLNNEIKILEYPVNSSADDFGIWVDSTNESGYFSSNRNPKTSDDIYHFRLVYPDFKDSPSPKTKDKFCFTFFEAEGLANKDTIDMAYEWNFGDGQKARTLRARHCYDKPGTYKVQLNVVEKNSGEIFTNELSYEHVVEPPACLVMDCLDNTIAGKEISLNCSQSALKGYVLLNTYWSFGDGKLNLGKEVNHTYRKKGEYIIELGVVAKNEATNKKEKFRILKKIIVSDPL